MRTVKLRKTIKIKLEDARPPEFHLIVEPVIDFALRQLSLYVNNGSKSFQLALELVTVGQICSIEDSFLSGSPTILIAQLRFLLCESFSIINTHNYHKKHVDIAASVKSA